MTGFCNELGGGTIPHRPLPRAHFLLLCAAWTWIRIGSGGSTVFASAYFTPPPPVSPATGLPNCVFEWTDDCKVRYQRAISHDNDIASGKITRVLVLVHGLFVNCDHWRETLTAVRNGELGPNVACYALDLLGSGHSSKPLPPYRIDDSSRPTFNGETGRNLGVVPSVTLGTASGGRRTADVDLRHPLGSPYNFYTWAKQVTDFTEQIVQQDFADVPSTQKPKTTLVCNSIGTISSLQAALDRPDLYDGVFVVSPNFRELHSAEAPLPALTMPLVRSLQGLLRGGFGKTLFDALAKPDTVKAILQEPYAVSSKVDDVLVKVLLDPLLTPGAAEVVFDTLSYSAGPLPELQLASLSGKKQLVEVVYGLDDPWTPSARVEKLQDMAPDVVQKVTALPGVGHCPHDEAPELVHPLLKQFLERLDGDREPLL